MSNQQMLFSDPEWRPPKQGGGRQEPRDEDVFTPRPVNTDPREQSAQQERAYMGPGVYTAPGPQQMAGERVQPQPQRRKRGPWFWIILILIIVALSGIGRMGFGGFGFHSSITDSPRHFSGLQGNPTIVVNDNVGTIRVHSGNTNEVTVIASKESDGLFGNPNDIHVDAFQDGNTIAVKVDTGFSFFTFRKVDLDVTVPNSADLRLETDTGEIDVSGVSGQMSLHSDTGSINATQDNLSGASRLTTDTGSINFNGSLDPTGTYQFQADTGSINVTVPGSSAFHLEASSDTGSINSNFPGVQDQIQHPDNSSSKVSADVGSNPQATMILKTDTGSITLNMGG